MMPSSSFDNSESFANRRGHSNQLSISDPSHHVTEAIGTLYGDSDDDSLPDPGRNSRPLSYMASPYGGEQIQKHHHSKIRHPQQLYLHAQNEKPEGPHQLETQRTPFPATSATTFANNASTHLAQTPPAHASAQKLALTHDTSALLQPISPLSPTLSLRDVQSDVHSTSQFPITNIDNPDDIAQELSNLQALRRMSIDVGNSADPDLMPFQGLALMAMPSIAPSGEDDEGDISRLLWVPAKVHPELAPDQFKNFLENRVQSMRRRSGESLLSIDVTQSNSTGLRRKKSMLSRQVDSDGTTFSNRHGGKNKHITSKNQGPLANAVFSAPELSLNELVKDPSKVVQKLTMDAQRQTESSLETSTLYDDKPILVVPTMGLRRSTRTTYRKGGSLRTGNRQPLPKRAVARSTEKDFDKDVEEESSTRSGVPILNRALQRALTDPVSLENLASAERRPHPTAQESEIPSFPEPEIPLKALENASVPVPLKKLEADITSPVAAFHATAATDLPQHMAVTSSHESTTIESAPQFPQRSSSQNPSSNLTVHKSGTDEQHYPPPRSKRRPSAGQSNTQQADSLGPTTADATIVTLTTTSIPIQTPRELALHTSAAPHRSNSPAPNYSVTTDERKSDKKSKEKDDSEGSKSMSWKWFKSDDKEKRKKDKDEQAKKARTKSTGERTQTDKPHDNARLDVLQSSIDNAGHKGRESIVLEREIVDSKVRDDKKRDTGRKSSEGRKEKDGFSFGSIFGGSRRRENKETGSNKGKQRAISPEPPTVLLRPDVDYPFTRFPIVEERAIYRMAHIKLANPRRDLRSQVLLSNFMYSYLAKVQAMHPQLNVPTSPQQKRQDEERKRREHEEQQQKYVEQQMQMQQMQSQLGIDEYSFEYHKTITEYEDSSHRHENHADNTADSHTFPGSNNDHNSLAVPNTDEARDQNHDDQGAKKSSMPHGYYDDQRGDDGMW